MIVAGTYVVVESLERVVVATNITEAIARCSSYLSSDAVETV